MADNDKIYNDDHRRTFLRNADPRSLNEYLKNMEKLSKRKPQYMEIYTKDLDFLLNVNDAQYQNGGNILNFFGGGKNNNNNSEKQATEVCNTEVYVNRIKNITQNSYCAITTQKTKNCDNTCDNRFNELQLIKQILVNDASCIKSGNDWIKAITKFIDIMICCGTTFSLEQYEPLRTVYFKELSKVIANNPKFTKEAYFYLNKILSNEKNRLSTDFMKAYSKLRSEKTKTTRTQYDAAKEKLIGEYIVKLGPLGFQIVYTSKFVEKVINAYKQQNKM
jgi:hypothetical protein